MDALMEPFRVYVSDQANLFSQNFHEVVNHSNKIVKKDLSISSQREIGNLLNDTCNEIERLLNNENVRVQRQFLPAVGNIEDVRFKKLVNSLIDRLKNLVLILCQLADSVHNGLEVNDQETQALNRGNQILLLFKLCLDSFELTSKKWCSSKAFFMYERQNEISHIINQNWDRFKCSDFDKIQNMIMNGIDQIELILSQSDVHLCDNNVQFGRPFLPEEPTFHQLLKRLKNCINVLCLLIESNELKQGPDITQDEIKVISESQKILDNLVKKIYEFVLELGGSIDAHIIL